MEFSKLERDNDGVCDERSERRSAIELALRISCNDDQYLQFLVGKLLSAVDASVLFGTWTRICQEANEDIDVDQRKARTKECHKIWRSIGAPKHFATDARIVFLKEEEDDDSHHFKYEPQESDEKFDAAGNYVVDRDSCFSDNSSMASTCRSIGGTKYNDIRLGDWIKIQRSNYWLRVAAIDKKLSRILCDAKKISLNQAKEIKQKTKIEVFQLWGATISRRKNNENTTPSSKEEDKTEKIIILSRQSTFRRKAALAKLCELQNKENEHSKTFLNDTLDLHLTRAHRTSLSLSWEKTTISLNLEMYNYEFDSWVVVYTGDSNTVTITNLFPDTTYTFRLCDTSTLLYANPVSFTTISQNRVNKPRPFHQEKDQAKKSTTFSRPEPIDFIITPTSPDDDWSTVWCNKYQRTFYFNKITHRSRWTPPPSFVTNSPQSPLDSSLTSSFGSNFSFSSSTLFDEDSYFS
uniref:WW domain-containing protein n=1 Tax=Aureoumbra lagunensis TaxID=44058 RepID=A0A7S3NJH7_9STRA